MRHVAVIVGPTHGLPEGVEHALEHSGLQAKLVATVELALDDIWEQGGTVALACVQADAVSDDELQSLIDVVVADWPQTTVLISGCRRPESFRSAKQIIVSAEPLSTRLIEATLAETKLALQAG